MANRQIPSPSQEIVAGQANIEEAYHALALGDPEAAIVLGIIAQRGNLTLWEPLLEAVAQAPIKLMPDDVERQAYNALACAEQHHDIQDAVKAIILCTWLLKAFIGTPEQWAGTQNNLGIGYLDLPGGDREVNLRRAIECYEAALQVFQLVHVDYYASGVNRNLEGARDELQRLEKGESQDPDGT